MRQGVLFVILFCLAEGQLKRDKRWLIFPRQAPTRHQFIAGVGIPADLSYESLTVGYVLKAMYWLPYNATVYRENPFWPEYPADYYKNRTKYKHSHYKNNKYHKYQRSVSDIRWRVYDYLRDRIETYGLNGRECLLKAICEANALPFDSHHNVFAQIIHILFKPSSSVDSPCFDSTHYREAEHIGIMDRSCTHYACDISLIDCISQKLKF